MWKKRVELVGKNRPIWAWGEKSTHMGLGNRMSTLYCSTFLRIPNYSTLYKQYGNQKNVNLSHSLIKYNKRTSRNKFFSPTRCGCGKTWWEIYYDLCGTVPEGISWGWGRSICKYSLCLFETVLIWFFVLSRQVCPLFCRQYQLKNNSDIINPDV